MNVPVLGNIEYLTALDAAWLRMEERGNPVDIAGLMLFDGELANDRLRELIEERVIGRHRRFRQRAVDSRRGIVPPHWEEEPDFSIDHHLHRIELPANAGMTELQALIGRLQSEPMDLGRSPWQLYRIDGLPEGTALVSRIHHCMGDGFALMQILLSLADSDERELEANNGRNHNLRHFDELSHARLADLAHLARDGIKALGHLLLLSFDSPSTLRGSLSGERRVAWTKPLALSRIKAIGHQHGATVNDVLLVALSGALRRFLAERGDRVDELSIRAIAPVNLRPANKPIDLEHGNWFGLLYIDLPVRSADPDARTAQIQATIQRIKSSQEPIVSLGVLAAMGRAPAVVEHVMDDLFARKGSLVMTNVPGPRSALRVAGTGLRDILFWVPHSGGLALGVSILSYAGNVRIGVRSDVAVIADPGVLARHLEQEVEWLEERPKA